MAGRSVHSEMPLTLLQRQILKIIASNRSEESHFAGGLVMNSADDSARYSRDFDIFHEAEEEVARASDADVHSICAAGFQVTKLQGDWNAPSPFRKAFLEQGDERLEIDWAVDSAFRFFPIEQDAILGWRLHPFDAATNKALALASRSVTRDYVDIVELRNSYSFEAILWAACGKDTGFTPLSLLEMMRRFARVNPRQLETIQARSLDPVKLKGAWINMSDEAERQINEVATSLPDTPLGVAFVDEKGRPGWIGDDSTLSVHYPSVRGCWPSIRQG